LRNDEDAAYLIFRDVSERKVAEALLSGEKRLLEVVAAGGPLSTTLDALCRLAEDVDPNSLVSILLVDRQGKQLHHGAGPSLPPTYVNAINGAPVGLGVGPCAAAAHLGEQVISLDMSADYRWSDEMRALTLAHGLRTCWSTPIKSSQGRVLGTFAIYPREPADPTLGQRSRIEQLTHLASIAIERAQSMDALRRSEERYALAMEAAADGHMDWNLVTGEFYISPRMLTMVGHAPDAAFVDRADWVRRFPFHPEDRPRWEAAIAAHFAGREAKFRGDFRIVLNGETRWLAFNFIATRDASGNVIRWTGSIADINDAKRDIATVLDAIPGLVAILTPAGEVDAVNNELVAYCGQPLDAMRQWGTNGTVHAEDLPRVTAVFMHSMSTGEPYDFEARIRRSDGVYRWNQVRGLPFRDSSGRIVRWYVLLSDIDASKRAEESLRLSEERYALAMRASGEGHWDWKIATDEFYVSPRYLELAGFPPDTKYSQRSDIVPLLPFHPDDRASYEAAVAAHFAGDTPRVDMVIRLVPNGAVRWLHVIGMCSRDPAGKPVRWAGSVSDITARKLAEEALKLSEQRYSLAMEAAQDAHWDWIVGTDQYYTSPRVAEILGFPPGTTFTSREDYLAKTPLVKDDLDAWQGAARELFAGTGSRLSMDLRAIINGEVRWIQHHGVVFRDESGRAVRWCGTVRDTTDRRRADEALRESEKRYERAMVAAQAGFWDWDVPADDFYVSPKLLEMTDFPAGTRFVGRADFMARAPFDPDDRIKWESAVKELFATGGTRLAKEMRSIHGGETRWVSLNGLCVRDADGKVLRWTGSATDITARKRAEDALRRSEAALRLSDERHALAMQAAAEGHFDADLETGEMFVSARLNEIYALPRHARIVNRTEFLKQIPFHPEDRHLLDDIVKPDWVRPEWQHPTQDFFEYDCRIIPRPGEIRWIHTRGKLIRDTEGRARRRVGVVADITDRKVAEEALRLSEERYALAMEASEEGHFDWNVETDEIFASEHLQQLLGLPAHAEPRTRGELMAALIPFHPDDRERINQKTRDVLAGAARHHEFEYRVLRGQLRELRWIHARWKIFRDAQGVAQRIIGVVSDITERKRVEEALREQTERLQLGQAAMRMIIMDWNVTEDVLTWSDSPEWLRGPMPASGRYPLFKDQVHPEDRDRFLATRLRALETLQVQTTEFRLVRTDGEVIWVLERKHALADADGKPVRMLSAMFDITDRRRAEEALRRSEAALRLSEERYALAAAGSNDGIWDWDLLTNKMFVSERAQRIFGLEPGLTERLREEWHAMIDFHPVDHQAQRRMVDEYLSGERSGNEGEWRVRGKDGAYRWIRIRSICLKDATGTPIRMAGSVSDIDAQKKAEEALRQSEERYTLAVDGASQGIFDWDLPNDRVFHSQRAQEFLGLEPGESWRARREWAAVIRYEPEDVPRMRAGIRRHLNGETPTCDIEYRVVPREGEVRWLRQRGVLLRDASGKAYRMAGSIEDVTQRKVAAEALRESEMRFRGLTALWSDWYWRQDEHLRFTYSSAGGDWPGGSSRSSAIGMTRWEIPGVVPLSSSWDEHQALLAARKPFRDFEYSRPAADGTLRYVSSSGTPIFDDKGEFRGYQGVARDITERKAAEEKLRSRQEMVKLAQKAAGAVAFEWRAHAEGKNRWSPDLEAMYGIPAGSYDGTEASLKKLIHPEDWAKVRAAIKSSLKSGDLDAEYRVIHPDGAIRWLQAKGRTLFDPEGKPERVVGFTFDVTDRRVAQEEMQRMEQQLRQAQRLEALGTLAGGIAHDFNNLLGAILGYGEMALRDARAGSRLRRDIESIMIAGERGHALVERILAFSRSGLGERVAVHVEEVVRETLALFAAKLPRHIVIESRLHAGSAAVMGDPTQIHQVLMNLLANAVHAMSSSGTLRVSLDRLRLHAPLVVTTGSLGARDYVALDVSDSGGGIPSEIFEKIFDPFFTTKEVGVGTGLGLSLVHGIVTGLGGAIDVATTVGKGSAFKVYLPISGDVAVQSKPRRRLERKTGWTGRGRVMVIDDEEALVKLVTETLTELGCSAVGFTSSTKALEAFLAHPDEFDAVITDESMPAISGSELIHKMRALRATLPIVLVSGYVSTPVVERARNAGATEVLKKPLRARQLQIALERVLRTTSSSRNELASSKRPIGSAKPRRRVSAS
jgi:PAS domain S-box-containing protein